jgi:hypothetical protein
MSADVKPSVSIYHPAPADMRLTPTDGGGLHLDIANGRIWYTLGDVRFSTDIAEEAAAMRRLAELATEVAEELERRAAAS